MKQQCKRSDFESIHQLSNNHKKASKSSKNEKSHLGNHQCLSADEFCLDRHYFAAMLEEICSQIHQDGSCNGDIQRSISPYRCKQLDEINVQLLQMSAKAFIDQIYIKRRYMSNETASSKTKPFSDAAEILHLNRDLFLRLLQDPNCLLVKHIQKLQFPTKEKERINKFFLDSKSSESQRSGIGTYDNPESVMRIQKKKVYGLLWKKFRPRYGSSSKGNTNAVANEIVVLKPASKSMKNTENVSCHCSSSLESQQSFRNKGQDIKSTYFSLKEIKRRFKQAMGESQKQEKWIPLDGSLSKLSREKHSLKYVEKGVNHNISTGESAICSDAKRQEKQQKLVGLASRNGNEIDCNNEAESKKLNSLTTSSSKKQQFDIFAEAKRHLSERLKNVNVSEALRGKHSPRTLQMILSSPDHDFLVTRSPNRNTSAYVSAQMRFSPYNNIQKGKGVSCISPQKQNEEVPPFADFVSDDQSEVFKIRPKIPEKIDAETEVHKNICDIGDDLNSSGSNILQENESMLPRNLNILEVPYEPNVVDSICCGPCIEAIRLSEDTGYRNCSSADVSPEDHHQRSLLEASSSSLDISALEIADICKFREDHPSPVSVLEPFSPEDANSPISITQKPDESPLQPRCIDFDDHSQVQTPEDPTINVTACNDEEEYMQAYVRAVMQASNMNFEDLSSTSPSFPHILNAYAVDSVGLFQVESHCDLNLLLDCIHEVLIGVYQC
ncbi:hypothetical protein ACH5RR_041584 [Cinchona calisaya]|uniref:DUF3741 domain-containing protein n=1 Tax=Cinchona calisaya TaxID=153742 RepID=A0ABD2XU14_9GENT